MQLRQIKYKIQVLRSEYVPAERTPEGHLKKGTGRAKSIMVGSYDANLREITSLPTDLKSQLTDDEIEQIAADMATRQAAAEATNLAFAPSWIVQNLARLAAAEDPIAACSDEQIEQIRKALGELLAARRAAKKRASK